MALANINAALRSAFRRNGLRGLPSCASRVCSRNFSAASEDMPGPLTGQVVWVLGGHGIVGRGVCVGFLKAGATVVMNSTSTDVLKQLQHDLNDPANLICVKGTMHQPAGAIALTEAVMQQTGGKLQHVIAHSGVRWWGNLTKETTEGQNPVAKDLAKDAARFSASAAQEPLRHYIATQVLLPKLREIPGSSYTFLTGGAGDRALLAQVNAHAVWGLAKACSQDAQNSAVRIVELRSNLHHEHLQDSVGVGQAEIGQIFRRSADIGEICAGMVACKFGSRGLHHLNTFEDVDVFKSRFPCPEGVKDLPESFASGKLESAKPFS
jgi:NAD(P)-dependent dehydrogenase (short-subunit alcohol dehydrogenase family)